MHKNIQHGNGFDNCLINSLFQGCTCKLVSRKSAKCKLSFYNYENVFSIFAWLSDIDEAYRLIHKFKKSKKIIGTQWLSGRVLDSRPRGRGLKPHRCHCVVVLEQDTFILA